MANEIFHSRNCRKNAPEIIAFKNILFVHPDVGKDSDLQIEQLKRTHVGDKAGEAHGGEFNVDHMFVQWLNAEAVRHDFAVGVEERKIVPVS